MSRSAESSKKCVLRFFAELADGLPGDDTERADQQVRWWLPTQPDWLVGRPAVQHGLRGVLGDRAHPVAIAGSEDGSLVVLELEVRTSSGGRTPVTSVVQLVNDRIASGRTYVDVAAYDDHVEVAH